MPRARSESFRRSRMRGPKTVLARALRDHVKAVQLLAGGGNQEEKLVHQLRTAVKRLRASWRLLRPALSESAFRRENLRLRGISRRLAAARERKAIIKTLQGFLARTSSQKEFDLFFAALRAFRAQRDENGNGRPGLPTAALSALRQSLRRLEGRSLGAWGWAAAVAGLSDSYRKSRKAYRQASARQRDDVHHEWRKRTKDLWYQLEALVPELPAVRKQTTELGKLQADLGRAQDLAVLEERMAQRPRSFGGTRTVAALEGPVRREKRKLRKACLHRGEKLFRHGPRRFIRSLGFPADMTA